MKAKFRREALLSILVSYVTNGTDIIDFFSMVDEEPIFHDRPLVIGIMSMHFVIISNKFLFFSF